MPPARRHAAERPQVRWERQRAWAATIFGLGLLLFVWPFVRTPPLDIGRACAHVLGAWALLVVALHVMARSQGRGGERHRGDDV